MKQGGGTIIIHRKSLDCSVLLLHCMSLFMARIARSLHCDDSVCYLRDFSRAI